MDLAAPSESPAEVLATAGLEMGRVPLATQVVDGLRNLVLSGRIPPGTKLIQEQVAADLGVSRTPLREAIRVLVNEGLLTPIPSSGSVRVVSPSIDEVRDLYQVREVIDGLAARLCTAATLSPSVQAKLKESVDQLARASEPFDLNAFVTAHADFHVLIVASSGNTRVQQMEPLVRMSAQMLFRQFASGVGCGRGRFPLASRRRYQAMIPWSRRDSSSSAPRPSSPSTSSVSCAQAGARIRNGRDSPSMVRGLRTSLRCPIRG
jgi:DNA-binding GntR family transcriptional regulator